MKKVSIWGRVIWMFVLMPAVALAGCVHENPGDGGVDPSLVNVAADIILDLDWDAIEFSADDDETEPTRAVSADADAATHRVVVELFHEGVAAGRAERTLSWKEYESGGITFRLPLELHALPYHLVAWIDRLDPESGLPASFKIENLRCVEASGIYPQWSGKMECGFATMPLDLTRYHDEWNVNVRIPVKLESPLARYELTAIDMEDFRDVFAPEMREGEIFRVAVEGAAPVPCSFDAFKGEPAGDKKIPVSEMFLNPEETDEGSRVIGSFGVFIPSGRGEAEVSVTLLGKSGHVHSRVSEIRFPIERGKVTRVKGHFLTNVIVGILSVDDRWDGEIVIELD